MQSNYRLLCLTPGMPVKILDKTYVVMVRLDYSPSAASVAHAHYYYLHEPSDKNVAIKLLVNECTDGGRTFSIERPITDDLCCLLPSFGNRMPTFFSYNWQAYYGPLFGSAFSFQIDGNLEGVAADGGLLCDIRYETATVRYSTPQMIRFVSFDLGENWAAARVSEIQPRELTVL